ncbi:MAG: hypothetical protein JW881_19270 [Spirochaetales bacterium]|nr:hypothetical protein [Spirochaetales bacterium]
MKKINKEDMAPVEAEFASIGRACRFELIRFQEREGFFLFTLGEEEKSDPGMIAHIVFQVYDLLCKIREELFGFNIMISFSRTEPPERISEKLKKQLFSLESEEKIWVSRHEKDYFSKYFTYTQEGQFYYVSKKPERLKETEHKDSVTWVRKSVYMRLSDEITPLINGTEKEKIILIYGKQGTGRTTITCNIVKDFVSEKRFSYVPRLYTRFKNRSFIHPFVNSINLQLLNELPDHLRSWEAKVWKTRGEILHYLKKNSIKEQSPDHLYEDFLASYNLYLSGYLSMMNSLLMPGIVICDDVDTYEPSSMEMLNSILKDFLGNTSLLPVIVSHQSKLPKTFGNMPYHKIKIPPLEQNEIKSIGRTLYPGIKISKNLCNDLADYSKGTIVPVMNFFHYSHILNRLVKEKNHYAWKSKEEIRLDEGLSNTKVILTVITNFKENEKDILYYIYLSSGVLTRSELTEFLASIGFQLHLIDKIFLHLFHYGLISTGEYIIPTFPMMKNKIDEIMGTKTTYLKDSIGDYVIAMWKNGKIKSYVVLFSFFKNLNNYSVSLEVLHALIERKINENDFTNVKPFLDIKNLNLEKHLDDEKKHTLKMILHSGQLRMALLQGDMERADKICVDVIEKDIDEYHGSSFRAELFLNMAHYSLLKGESEEAVKYNKKSLMDYQEHGTPENVARAYINLGAIMLANEKIEDAFDYLNVALRTFPDGGHPYTKILIMILISGTLFMQGNISKAIGISEEGRELAASAGKREWELYLRFFTSRMLFELGLYAEAHAALMECLSLTSLYYIDKARPVIRAWLARVTIYSGKILNGISLLLSLEENRETLYFLSEGYFFQKQYKKALESIEKSIGKPYEQKHVPDEIITWENGYSAIEEKCFRTSDQDSIFTRLLYAFKAYMVSLNGNLKEGITEFYKITRGEKTSPVDPYNCLYYFLYSLVLQGSKDDEIDDSLTILNKAFKQLQERASRIEVPSDRTKFLLKNFWNHNIFNEAKKKNLI